MTQRELDFEMLTVFRRLPYREQLRLIGRAEAMAEKAEEEERAAQAQRSTIKLTPKKQKA